MTDDLSANRDKMRANLAMWDERVPIHVGSEMYANEEFKRGGLTIADYELEEVGDLRGKTLVHLQCHFGQDTSSWARAGAKSVTGLDFSPAAVKAANKLASDIGIDAKFVESDVYDALETLPDAPYDIVYTGRGALIWLPDLPRWAQIVTALLKPGGLFYIREHHPFPYIFDEDPAVASPRLKYHYFNDEALHDNTPGSYTDLEAKTTKNESYEWTHTIGELITALADAGLVVDLMKERDAIGYQSLGALVQGDDGMWRMPGDLHGSLPLEYTLRARKPG